MDQEIFTWLNSDQDYSSGLSLYDHYCRNSNLGKILRIGGATGKNRLTLAYELGKMIQHLVSLPDPVPGTFLDNPGIAEENKPVQIPKAVIEEIRKERKMIYKMLDNLHASLAYREKQERMKIAFEILDLDDRLKEITVRIEHYEQTGIILPKPGSNGKQSLDEKGVAKLIKRQYTVRTYLTRYKKLLEESESPEDRDLYQKKLIEYQLEMDEINKLLGQ